LGRDPRGFLEERELIDTKTSFSHMGFPRIPTFSTYLLERVDNVPKSQEYSILDYFSAYWFMPRLASFGLRHVIGQRLHQARKKAGLTQVQAARQLGCKQAFVSKGENGRRHINQTDFRDLARIYKTSVGELAGELTPAELSEAEDFERNLAKSKRKGQSAKKPVVRKKPARRKPRPRRKNKGRPVDSVRGGDQLDLF